MRAQEVGDRFAGRASGDRGAVIVEAALAAPVFFLLLFGIIEFAIFVNGNLTIANTTADAARSAAVFGNAPEADFNLVQAVKDDSDDGPRTDIVRIVVFKASGPDDSVPSSCKSGTPQTVGTATNPGVGSCNVYTPAAHFGSTDPTEFDCDAVSPSRFYCPTRRNVAANDPPDYLGVYIQMRHSFLTGLFGGGRTLERTSIVRLEPLALNSTTTTAAPN
jgi:hypothetical protein